MRSFGNGYRQILLSATVLLGLGVGLYELTLNELCPQAKSGVTYVQCAMSECQSTIKCSSDQPTIIPESESAAVMWWPPIPGYDSDSAKSVETSRFHTYRGNYGTDERVTESVVSYEGKKEFHRVINGFSVYKDGKPVWNFNVPDGSFIYAVDRTNPGMSDLLMHDCNHNGLPELSFVIGAIGVDDAKGESPRNWVVQTYELGEGGPRLLKGGCGR